MKEKKAVKDLIIQILSNEFPLKTVNILNYIRKRYGKKVTFQGVSKALQELLEKGIVVKNKKEFQLDKIWIAESKKLFDSAFNFYFNKIQAPKKSVFEEGETEVYEFDSLNAMMSFWQNLIGDWHNQLKRGEPKINCYQVPHAWEALLHLEKERILMGEIIKKDIKSYTLIKSNTPLDKQIKNFYNDIGVKSIIDSSTSGFDKSFYVATYGSLIVQTNVPDEIVKLLDNYFKKNKSLKDFNLKELSDIVNKKAKIKLTIIKNLSMAKQINLSITKEF